MAPKPTFRQITKYTIPKNTELIYVTNVPFALALTMTVIEDSGLKDEVILELTNNLEHAGGSANQNAGLTNSFLVTFGRLVDQEDMLPSNAFLRVRVPMGMGEKVHIQ